MFGKVKKSANMGMPKAPWIYVSDETQGQTMVNGLMDLIPEAECCSIDRFSASMASTTHPLIVIERPSTVSIAGKTRNAKAIQTEAITHGCNFVSVNLTSAGSGLLKDARWSTNHLDISSSSDAAMKVYKWLFTVLTVRETLHLIPADQMLATGKSFPDYEYCPISESSLRLRDAKIQFVALVLEKPRVSADKTLTWPVADRSGVVNFYFRYRDDDSQYTWDWVLNLKPGDRRALPRMPQVEIKEKKRTRVLKAPFRATGAILLGTGSVIKAIGNGISKLGGRAKMGSSSEWVDEADINSDGKRTDWSKPRAEHKRTVDVFNEKGEKSWSDEASVASTDVGSDFDEKIGADFL